MDLTFSPVADHGLLVTFSDEISNQTHERITAFDQAIHRARPAGFIETVPAMVNILVCFDPLVTDHENLKLQLLDLAQSFRKHKVQSTRHIIQVCYDQPCAPDLEAVSETCNLTKEEVINAHLSKNLKVLMYGFAPGYAYLNGLDDTIHVPRKAAAIRDVPAGSVIIAGPQCLVTTLKMPTGWSIIGRSPTPILFEDPETPFLFEVGDEVIFERIDFQAFERLSGGVRDE